jgi:hypothetical protein
MTNYAFGILTALVVLTAAFIAAVRQNPLAVRVALDRFVALITPEPVARTSNHISITRPYHVKDGRILVKGTPVVYRDRTTGIFHPATVLVFARVFDGDFYEMSDGAWAVANDVWEPVELSRRVRQEVGLVGKVAIA